MYVTHACIISICAVVCTALGCLIQLIQLGYTNDPSLEMQSSWQTNNALQPESFSQVHTLLIAKSLQESVYHLTLDVLWSRYVSCSACMKTSTHTHTNRVAITHAWRLNCIPKAWNTYIHTYNAHTTTVPITGPLSTIQCLVLMCSAINSWNWKGLN